MKRDKIVVPGTGWAKQIPINQVHLAHTEMSPHHQWHNYYVVTTLNSVGHHSPPSSVRQHPNHRPLARYDQLYLVTVFHAIKSSLPFPLEALFWFCLMTAAWQGFKSQKNFPGRLVVEGFSCCHRGERLHSFLFVEDWNSMQFGRLF